MSNLIGQTIGPYRLIAAVAKNPADRYPRAGALMAAFSQAVTGPAEPFSPPSDLSLKVGPVCPKCRHLNRPGVNFCENCALPPAFGSGFCPHCGYLNRPGDSFCKQCAAALARHNERQSV